MRLTLYVDGGTIPHAHGFPLSAEQRYAVLLLDLDRGIWSREAHQGIELPSWGTLHDVPDGMQLRSPANRRVLCVLHGLAAAVRSGQHNAVGTASWSGGEDAEPGHWRLQTVDVEQTEAEYETFKGEPGAAPDR